MADAVTNPAEPTHVVMGSSMSHCSACGGNANPNELTHLHGGPGSGWQPGSSLADENGCRAAFAIPPSHNGHSNMTWEEYAIFLIGQIAMLEDRLAEAFEEADRG